VCGLADENGAVVLVLGAGMLIGGLFVWLILRSAAPAAATRRVVYAPVRTTYTNEEEWDIVRDERGRVVGVRAHRRAEEGEKA